MAHRGKRDENECLSLSRARSIYLPFANSKESYLRSCYRPLGCCRCWWWSWWFRRSKSNPIDCDGMNYRWPCSVHIDSSRIESNRIIAGAHGVQCLRHSIVLYSLSIRLVSKRAAYLESYFTVWNWMWARNARTTLTSRSTFNRKLNAKFILLWWWYSIDFICFPAAAVASQTHRSIMHCKQRCSTFLRQPKLDCDRFLQRLFLLLLFVYPLARFLAIRLVALASIFFFIQWNCERCEFFFFFFFYYWRSGCLSDLRIA